MRLIVLDPGHFHATLLQKEMYVELDPRVTVYAPLGAEVIEYLRRVWLFNSRADNATRWEIDVHLSERFVDELLRDRAGEIVVFAGKNNVKIERMITTISAGLHCLSDKPWIIRASDMTKLEQALDAAEQRGIIAYDIMTERYEVTSELQRELVNVPEIFGEAVKGDPAHPGVYARSVHNVMKTVAGVPLRRPWWFFDVEIQGEGLSDVGTHVVDLVQWTLFPDQQFDYRHDIQVLEGRRWPLVLTKEQLDMVTGGCDLPLVDGKFEYYCNNFVHYTLRGIHVKMDISWDWEAPPGAGDIYEATFRGTRSNIEIRQGATEAHVPELYVVPQLQVRDEVFAALQKWAAGRFRIQHLAGEARVIIPQEMRVGHEAHFAQVARRFLGYVGQPGSLPAWERSFMLAKYYVSTLGVELGRQNR